MINSSPIHHILFPENWPAYTLLDSGHGRKLEAFGPYRFIRPEAQALWAPFLDDSEWSHVDGIFASDRSDDNDEASDGRGRWKLSPALPESWEMSYEDLRFVAQPTPFRHLGFFPEQSPHWLWTADQIKAFRSRHQRAPRLLNLFAYSGLASLHAAQAGAEVTHLDASKKAVAQAFENRDLSALSDAPIRFITDDASRFVEREIRRGRHYDGIMLDPPKYGRGPKGEVWRLEEHLPDLLAGCRALLSDTPLLFIATIYAIRTSTSAVQSAVGDALAGMGGILQAGELAIREEREAGRAIGQALYVRWSGHETS